jgi:hypothetical protein
MGFGGFGLVMGFIQLISFIDQRTLQITVLHTKLSMFSLVVAC